MKELSSGIEELIGSLVDALPDGIIEGMTEGAPSLVGPDALLGEIASALLGEMGEIGSFLLLLIGVSVLSLLCELLPGRSVYVTAGVGILVSYLLLSRLYPLFLEVERSLSEINSLFTGIMPVIIGYLVMGGGTTLAPAASVGMQITLYITGLFSSGVVIRLVLSMLIVGAISDGGVADRLARGLKNGFTRLIGILTAAVGGIIALETYIRAASDGAAIRMAKLTAGNMIPMVGSAVSGALATLVGGLGYVGGIIGGASVAALLVLALSPLIILLCYRGCFYLVDGVLSFLNKGRGVSILSAFSSALDALISVYAMTTVIYILEIIVFVMGGGALLG